MFSRLSMLLPTVLLLAAPAATAAAREPAADKSAFAAERAVRSHSFIVDLPSAQAFPLFEPEGERRWAGDWAPDYIFPADGRTESGMVFRTSHNHEDTVWMMLRHRPQQGLVEYARVTPGNRIATVLVQCKELAPRRTQVNVVYTITALGEEGNAFIRRWDEAHYREYIDSWGEAIRKAFPR